MPDEAQATFTEVVSITADKSEFADSLQELSDIYSAWVKGLGESADNVLGAGALSGLNSAIESLSTLAAEVLSSVQDVSAAVTSLLQSQDEVSDQMAQRERERVASTAKARIEAEQAVAEAKDALANGGSGAAWENLTNKQRALAEQIEIEQQGLADAQTVKDEERAQRQRTQAEEISLEQQGLEDRYSAQQTVDDEKRAARQRTLAEEIGLEQQGLVDRYEAGQEVADERIALRRRALAEEISLEQQGLTDKYEAEQEAADERRAQRQRALAEEIAIEQQGLVDRANEHQDKGSGVLGGLADTIANVIKFQLAWQAVGEAIQVVTDLVKAPFDIIAGGIKYLDETQTAANKLVGTLAANVQYSADLAENFRLAAQAADAVTRKLQDAAAASGLPLQNFQRVFEILTTAGAAATVGTTDQLVQLTAMVTLFEQAAKGSNELRSVVTDLPKLLNGTLTNTSALVQATGINAAQWKVIVASAKEHGNLVEVLTPIFAPYLAATQLAALQHANMNAELKLQFERLEALVAQPFYRQVIAWLKEILDWTDQNRDKVLAWVAVLQDIVGQFTRVAAILSGAGGIGTVVEAVATGFTTWLATLATAAEYMAIIARLSINIFDATTKGDFKDAATSLAAITEVLTNGGDAAARFQRTLTDIAKAVVTPAGSTKEPSVLDLPIAPKGNHPSTDKTPAGKKDFRGEHDEELAGIKSFYDEARELVKDGEAQLWQSKRDGAAAIKAIDEAEIVDVKASGERYKTAITAFYNAQIAAGKATAGDRDNALKEANAGIKNQVRALNDQTDAAERAGDAEGNEVGKIRTKNKLDLVKAGLQEELALKKDAYQQGLLTEGQLLDQEQASRDKAHVADIAVIDDELAHTAAGTTRYAALVAQRKLIDAQYNAAWLQGFDARYAAGEKEDQQQREHVLQLAQLSRAQQSDILGGLSKATGRNVDQLQFQLQDQSLAAQEKELQIELQLVDAKNKETEAARKLAEQLAKVRDERTAAALKAVAGEQGSTDPQFVKNLQSTQILQTRLSQLTAQGPGQGQSQTDFEQSLKDLKAVIDAYTPSLDSALQHVKDKLFGFDISGVMDKISNDPSLTDSQKNLAEFAAGLSAASNALSNIKGVVNDIQNGGKQGGIAGALGAGVTDLSKMGLDQIPVIGQFLPAIGGLLSFFGGLFTTTAQQIADNVKKSFSQTLNNYQNGNDTLAQTVIALEQQRQNAIQQLSGKKGGQDQLNSLLPQFDQQIAQLEQQQKQIITNFNTQLQGLQTQSDTLSQIQQQWTQIVTTVQQYLNAGGDATAATQYLSLQLQQMQKGAQDQLNQANDQAVQDAINLNNLLQQRLNLQQSYNQQVFQLTNQDALERTTGAVSRAEQIQVITQQYQQQLTDLNSQITLSTQKVNLESQVFDIATDIATLHQQDAALQLQALELQIAKYNDLKAVINSIWQQGNGVFTTNNPLLTSNPSVIVNINGNIVGVNPNNPLAVGQQIGQGISQTVINALTNGQSNILP